jgi:hypothetical protein
MPPDSFLHERSDFKAVSISAAEELRLSFASIDN